MSTHERRLGDGRVFAGRGELDRAEEAFSDALASASGDAERSRALGGLGVVRDRRGHADGLSHLEEAVRLARLADPEGLGVRLHDLGLCRLRAGDAQGAIAVLEEAWPLAADDGARVRTVEVLGQACLDGGAFRAADSSFMQLLSLAQSVSRPDVAVRAHNGRGEALRRAGRLEEAKACFQRVVEAMGPVRHPSAEQQEQAGVALHNLGVLMLEERPDAAGAMLDQAVKCFVGAFGSTAHPHVARSKAFQGRLALLAGNASRAQALFAEALALVPLAHPVAQELVPMLREAPRAP